MTWKKIKGSLYVGLAAASYGVLASMVKYANIQGVHISLLTGGQFFFGIILLFLLQWKTKAKTELKDRKQLLWFGLSFGATSIFYYLSLLYIPVSLAIILLMQAIWMGVVLEIILHKKINYFKLLGAGLAIFGTLLAANLFNVESEINLKGFGFGLLAALSYTCNMYASDKVALSVNNISRSFYFILGGSIAVSLFWNTDLIHHFQLKEFFVWGIPLAIFGTVLPPLLFAVGMPKIGTGLGGIISSFEIPVSLACAYIILGEQLLWSQWFGVVIILLSILLINIRSTK